MTFSASAPVDQVYLLAMAMLSFVSRCKKPLGVDSRFFFPSSLLNFVSLRFMTILLIHKKPWELIY